MQINNMNLHDELTTGPLSAEIAPHIQTGSDGEIYAILNRKDIPVNGVVSTNAFAIWAAKTGLRAAIQDHAENSISPLRSIALALLDTLQGNLADGIDFGLQDNIDMLNAWVSAGAITVQQKNDLLALSQKLISRAEQLNEPISIQDIATALRG